MNKIVEVLRDDNENFVIVVAGKFVWRLTEDHSHWRRAGRARYLSDWRRIEPGCV